MTTIILYSRNVIQRTRFTVFTDLPGLPPISYIHGPTFDLGYIYPDLPRSPANSAYFLPPPIEGKEINNKRMPKYGQARQFLVITWPNIIIFE